MLVLPLHIDQSKDETRLKSCFWLTVNGVTTCTKQTLVLNTKKTGMTSGVKHLRTHRQLFEATTAHASFSKASHSTSGASAAKAAGAAAPVLSTWFVKLKFLFKGVFKHHRHLWLSDKAQVDNLLACDVRKRWVRNGCVRKSAPWSKPQALIRRKYIKIRFSCFSTIQIDVATGRSRRIFRANKAVFPLWVMWRGGPRQETIFPLKTDSR